MLVPSNPAVSRDFEGNFKDGCSWKVLNAITMRLKVFVEFFLLVENGHCTFIGYVQMLFRPLIAGQKLCGSIETDFLPVKLGAF